MRTCNRQPTWSDCGSQQGSRLSCYLLRPCRDKRGVYTAAEGLNALPCGVMTSADTCADLRNWTTASTGDMRVKTRGRRLLQRSTRRSRARTPALRRALWCATPNAMRRLKHSYGRLVRVMTERIRTHLASVCLSGRTVCVRLWTTKRLGNGGVAHLFTHGTKRMTSRMASRSRMRMARKSGTCSGRRGTRQVERWECSRVHGGEYTPLRSSFARSVKHGGCTCRTTHIRLHDNKHKLRCIGRPRQIVLGVSVDKRNRMGIANGGSMGLYVRCAELLLMRL